MRIRAVAAAGLVLAAVLLGLPPSVPPATAAPLSLTVDPPAAVAPVTVGLTGACAGESDPDGMVYPDVAFVTIQGSQLGEQQVALVDGTFTGVPFAVPAELAPQGYEVQLRCPDDGGDTFATDDFTVLAAPTLQLDPVQGPAGTSVSASGTCPQEQAGPDVLFDGDVLATASTDGTGAFGPTTWTVPETADGPEHTVTTSCGGQASFTLVVAVPDPEPVPDPVPDPDPDPEPVPDPEPEPGPPAPPPPTLVAVPDLSELTFDAALATLTSAGLVLAEPQDRDGTVVSQSPGPGKLVPAGTAVSIDLAPPPGTAGGSRPAVPATIVLLALLATGATTAAVSAERARRRHARERRWADGQVTLVPEPRGTRPRHVPDSPVPALDVRLEVRSGATRLYVQEAVHARD